MSANPSADVESTRKKAIIVFILFAVTSGIALILGGVFFFRDSYVEMMLATIGSTLIAVGVVDVVSEMFMRPGIVELIRQSLPLFADPSRAPKEALKKQLVEASKFACPNPSLREDFAQFIEHTIADQLTVLCREDFTVSLKLEKMPAHKKLAKITCEWNYRIRNHSSKEESYEVPFYCNTFLATAQGVPLGEHIKVDVVQVTHGVGATENIGESRGIYVQQPKQSNSKVELVPSESLPTKLLPQEMLSVYVKYSYIADVCDRHSQRMSILTHNANLNLDFSEKEFIVTVDEFCQMKKVQVAKHRAYSWNGWFLPNHGFIVEWKTA